MGDLFALFRGMKDKIVVRDRRHLFE